MPQTSGPVAGATSARPASARSTISSSIGEASATTFGSSSTSALARGLGVGRGRAPFGDEPSVARGNGVGRGRGVGRTSGGHGGDPAVGRSASRGWAMRAIDLLLGPPYLDRLLPGATAG